ncbi:MAG: hypothetical protein DWQ36_09540 [Acidobacteria bacterium]|nr:MAG: hypothetical protein DWQ30_00820 [Acidobacteriota bacterium]REK08304.1 MAG: hypothetical protein DWQ36_09540 [Acidobacteriota bacterium]
MKLQIENASTQDGRPTTAPSRLPAALLAPLLAVALLGCGSSRGGSEPTRQTTELYTCEMSFTLSGWSAIYKRADGQGRVSCSNGESAEVALRLRGGGLTAGKTEILEGTGKFSGVKGIEEIYGSYAAAGAQGGAVKASEAIAMTKGPVSLALAGTGRGFSLGLDISRFTIRRISD